MHLEKNLLCIGMEFSNRKELSYLKFAIPGIHQQKAVGGSVFLLLNSVTILWI